MYIHTVHYVVCEFLRFFYYSPRSYQLTFSQQKRYPRNDLQEKINGEKHRNNTIHSCSKAMQMNVLCEVAKNYRSVKYPVALVCLCNKCRFMTSSLSTPSDCTVSVQRYFMQNTRKMKILHREKKRNINKEFKDIFQV